MNVVSRGIRNAFRNVIRTFSIVIILGLSIGLSLVMLIAHQAVGNKIESVKRSLGNTVTIRPPAFSEASQANNALTTSQLDKVRQLAHITKLTESLSSHVTTIGTTSMPVAPAGAVSQSISGDDGTNGTTNLKSAVKLNTNGDGSGPGLVIAGGSGQAPKLPSNFSPPIDVRGTTSPTDTINDVDATIKIVDGKAIDGTKDTNNALVSSAMAKKNNLKVGSTFEAYKTTLTVVGIFDSNTEAGNNFIILSLPALQRLSGNTHDVTEAVAHVDSITNIGSTAAAIKNALGAANADVTSSEETVKNAIKPLQSIQSISLYSLIGAVAAGAIIILLTMIMIVRERKREIGVIKALGFSNLRIMIQFMTEALTLTILGALIGLVIGIAGGSPVTKTLVDNSTNSSNNMPMAGPAGTGGIRSFTNNSTVQGIRDVQAEIGWNILLDGLGAAVLIALIGSAMASLFISKVRPAEVLRSE